MPITQYKGKETRFRRIWGGACFPGQQAGFIVVIGEQHSLQLHPYMEFLRYRLINEFESWDLDELLTKILLFSAEHQATFFGRTSHENDFAIGDFNDRGYKKNLPWVNIREAPLIDTEGDRGRISYHINAIRNLIKDGILHKHELEGSSLHRYLMEIPQANLQEVTDHAHPAVGALGYVVAALSELGTDQEARQNQEEANQILEEYWD